MNIATDHAKLIRSQNSKRIFLFTFATKLIKFPLAQFYINRFECESMLE